MLYTFYITKNNLLPRKKMREGLEPSLSFESKTQKRREELVKGSSHLQKIDRKSVV